MQNSAARAYQQVGKQTVSPRVLEANLLSRAAAQLQIVRDDWDNKRPDLYEALLFNRKLWNIFLTSVTGEESRLPDKLREALADLVKPWQISGGYRPYQPVGCVDCRMTGFRGRMGLYELLTVTEAFKDKVSREPQMEALRRQAVADGMRPLRLAGAARVAEGLTTLDEVLACTPPVQ
mgnify:CR=1 FL=1